MGKKKENPTEVEWQWNISQKKLHKEEYTKIFPTKKIAKIKTSNSLSSLISGAKKRPDSRSNLCCESLSSRLGNL